MPAAARVLRSLVVAAVAVAGLAAVQVATAAPASAAGRYCYAQEVSGVSGGITYHVECHSVSSSPGTPGGGGSAGGSPPPDTCKLAEFVETEEAIGTHHIAWCEGTSRCMIHDPPTESDDSKVAAYAKLNPPATVVEIFCADAFLADAGGWTLAVGNVGTPTQLIDRANEAYGNLAPPPPGIHTSPNSPSVVRIDTWFWVELPTFQQVEGTPAEGMVAVADPTDTDWAPGDGAGTMGCARNGGQDCQHVYTRASSGQGGRDRNGKPAYTASVTRNYTVHYEFFGMPVVVPGSRLDFAQTTTFGLAVAEVQAENN